MQYTIKATQRCNKQNYSLHKPFCMHVLASSECSSVILLERGLNVANTGPSHCCVTHSFGHTVGCRFNPHKSSSNVMTLSMLSPDLFFVCVVLGAGVTSLCTACITISYCMQLNNVQELLLVLSSAVRSVRVCDITKLNLVPSIVTYSTIKS